MTVVSGPFSELRARRALLAAGFDSDRPLVRVESVTNEVWDAGDVVVRVNRRTHPRLRREAALGGVLPAAVRYPRIVAAGLDAGDDWVVQRRAPGVPLVRCWPWLPREDRRRAVDEVAAGLRALHSVQAPAVARSLHEPPHPLQLGPRSTAPLCEALERAGTLPHVDAGALRDAIGWVRTLQPVLDGFESETLVHGDLHFQNVLWGGDQVTALLDLEFARAAPADLDLDVFLRFCCMPHLFVPVGCESEARLEDYEEVPFWLREAYPELFSHPRLLDRLRLYAVAFNVRHLLDHPPTRSSSGLTRHHPYRRLLAVLRGASHVDLLARLGLF